MSRTVDASLTPESLAILNEEIASGLSALREAEPRNGMRYGIRIAMDPARQLHVLVEPQEEWDSRPARGPRLVAPTPPPTCPT